MIIRAGGSIGAVTLGGSEGVDVLAGIRPAVQGETLRRAAAPADFTSSAFIASVTIKGMGTTDRYFSDSSFSASRIGAVKLTNVQWDNGTAPFGFFARNTRNGGIRFVKWKDTKAPRDPLLNGSWTPRQGVVNASPGNDLGIQLI